MIDTSVDFSFVILFIDLINLLKASTWLLKLLCFPTEVVCCVYDYAVLKGSMFERFLKKCFPSLSKVAKANHWGIVSTTSVVHSQFLRP